MTNTTRASLASNHPATYVSTRRLFSRKQHATNEHLSSTNTAVVDNNNGEQRESNDRHLQQHDCKRREWRGSKSDLLFLEFSE